MFTFSYIPIHNGTRCIRIVGQIKYDSTIGPIVQKIDRLIFSNLWFFFACFDADYGHFMAVLKTTWSVLSPKNIRLYIIETMALARLN